MTVPGKVGEDLLLVSSEACVLLDGQELAPRWIFSAARVLRYSVFLQEPRSDCRPGALSLSLGCSPGTRPAVGGGMPVCFCPKPLAHHLVTPCHPSCTGGAGAVLSALASASVLALVWAGVAKGKTGGYTSSQVFLHRGPVRALLPCLLAEDPSLATTNLTPWLWSLKMEPALTDRLAVPAFEAPPLFIVEGR